MKSALFISTIPETLNELLLPFAEHFRFLGWRVDGMARGINDFFEDKQGFDRVWDVEWSCNPLDPKNILVAVPRIQEVITAEQYDIVHVHTPIAAFITRFALRNRQKQAKISHTSVIYTAHGFHFDRGGNLLKNLIF
ncbi:MAG: glycosyltransferase [Xenococcaceae cyanobacterium MO_188.B32]|nr:glycosyltransferase [Xenococcaceae cyanobacterium MO_188.B32]